MLVRKALPQDVEALRILLKTSQDALVALISQRRRLAQVEEIALQLADESISDDEISHRLALIGDAEVHAMASDLSDFTLLSQFIGDADWDQAMRPANLASILQTDVSPETRMNDSLSGKDSFALWMHRLRTESAMSMIELLTKLRDDVLEALQPGSVITEKPRWNNDACTLTFRGVTVRQLKSNADRSRQVLNIFEAQQWPTRIELSAAWDDSDVRQVVQTLNKGLSGLQFHAANERGPGKVLLPGIKWLPCATPAQAP